MFMSQEEYQRQLVNIRKKNESKNRKRQLKREKNKYKKQSSTSKVLLLAIVFLCFEIVLFSEYIMIYLKDTSALYTLIGAPVTLIPISLGYYYKSMRENTKNGIIYETALLDHDENETDNEDITNDIVEMTSEEIAKQEESQ